MDVFDDTNGSGMFRRSHTGIYHVTHSKRNFMFYYVTNPGIIIKRPRTGDQFWNSLSDLSPVRKGKDQKRRRPTDRISNNFENTNNINKGMNI